MSNVKVNTINDANGGSNAVLYGVAAPANSMGFRNRLINSDMRIDQRNNGASVIPASSAYTLDRWRVGVDTTQRMSFRQVSDAPAGFTNSILCTVTTAGSTSASNLLYLQQNIEGFNVSDLDFGTASAKTVTASFWVKSSVVGLKSISLINSSLNRAYCTTYNIDVANTWEYKTVTIPGETSGTWETGNGVGLELHFNFQIGSTYETTLNTWAAGRFYSASSVPDITNTSGATISFTGVQLEAGSVASPFERRDYGRELMMCQRYYEVITTSNNVFGFPAYCASSTIARGAIPFKVTKRASPTAAMPTLAATNINSVPGNWNPTSASFYTDTCSVGFDLTASSATFTNGQGCAVGITGTGITLSSEL